LKTETETLQYYVKVVVLVHPRDSTRLEMRPKDKSRGTSVSIHVYKQLFQVLVFLIPVTTITRTSLHVYKYLPHVSPIAEGRWMVWRPRHLLLSG